MFATAQAVSCPALSATQEELRCRVRRRCRRRRRRLCGCRRFRLGSPCRCGGGGGRRRRPRRRLGCCQLGCLGGRVVLAFVLVVLAVAGWVVVGFFAGAAPSTPLATHIGLLALGLASFTHVALCLPSCPLSLS